MWQEQKLALPTTKVERVANLIGIAALSMMVTMLLLQWSQLPNEVPAHFGFNGEVDRWGSKWELLLLPATSIALHLFLQVIEVRPHTHNYPTRLNDQNREAFYLHSRRTLNLTKNLCTLLFAYLTWRTILIAKGAAVGLGMIPFSIILCVLVGIVIWGMVGISRIR